MNSSEQKDFEHATPTEEEVQKTIAQIEERLSNNTDNSEELTEGYKQVVRILTENLTTYDDLSADATSSDTAQTLAVLAVRYLNGETGADVLLNYPHKKQ